MKNICVEGDNLVVINFLEKVWEGPWEIENIIDDAYVDLLHLGSVSFSHYFREANFAADFLARRGQTCCSVQ